MGEIINIWGKRITVPLTMYLSSDNAAALKPAMLICPGGAYREHAVHEGHGYVEWLTKHGIHCFVLEYRLGSQGHRFPKPFQDVVRAIKPDTSQRVFMGYRSFASWHHGILCRWAFSFNAANTL